MKRKVKSLIFLIIIGFVSITIYKYFYKDNKKDGIENKKEIIIEEKNEFQDIIGYTKDNLDKYNSYKTINTNISNEEIVKRINEFSNIYSYNKDNLDRYASYKILNSDLTNEEIVKRINLYLDYNFYTHDIDSLNKQTSLILVNKFFYLGEDYVPNNLVLINNKYANGSSYGESEAVDMFMKMCDAAKLNSLNIRAISVYRSFATQRAIYNSYLKNDSVASVDTYSARAGYSEHQTGLAFDVYNGRISYTAFGDTNEYKWINDNSYKYGFIVRYKKETQYITGYKYEPWHLRYVGIEAATYIYNNNITLEEYLLNKK